jgi:two-component system nitrogen regulation sensor histidine kinase NtrY
VITEDREVFDQCTDTIIRQVGDIGRMVDEFSSFARMPKPEMQTEDVRDRCARRLPDRGQPLRTSTSSATSERPLTGPFDRRLLAQA